jgi:hypothetical protein
LKHALSPTKSQEVAGAFPQHQRNVRLRIDRRGGDALEYIVR